MPARPDPEPRRNVAGLLLAGGLSRRMGGGDKCLQPLAGRPMLAHVIDRLAPQLARLAINANGDARRFAEFDLPVAPDVVEGFAGPLAGVLTGLDWAARAAPECVWVLTVATDTPFLPADLAAGLAAAVRGERADIAAARSGGRAHPVFALWPVDLAADLRRALVEEDLRKVDRWTARYRLAHADFPIAPFDPFFNINEPADLAEAERILAAGGTR